VRNERERGREGERERANGGFTLVEVLVAMVVVATVIIIVAQGFSVGAGASSSSQKATRAAMLAESKMAEFETGEVSLTSAPSGDFQPDWPAFSYTSTIDADSFSAYRVTITVTWDEPGGKRSFVLARIMTERPASTGSPR